jgi:hypothetical protein
MCRSSAAPRRGCRPTAPARQDCLAHFAVHQRRAVAAPACREQLAQRGHGPCAVPWWSTIRPLAIRNGLWLTLRNRWWCLGKAASIKGGPDGREWCSSTTRSTARKKRSALPSISSFLPPWPWCMVMWLLPMLPYDDTVVCGSVRSSPSAAVIVCGTPAAKRREDRGRVRHQRADVTARLCTAPHSKGADKSLRSNRSPNSGDFSWPARWHKCRRFQSCSEQFCWSCSS